MKVRVFLAVDGVLVLVLVMVVTVEFKDVADVEAGSLGGREFHAIQDFIFVVIVCRTIVRRYQLPAGIVIFIVPRYRRNLHLYCNRNHRRRGLN